MFTAFNEGTASFISGVTAKVVGCVLHGEACCLDNVFFLRKSMVVVLSSSFRYLLRSLPCRLLAVSGLQKVIIIILTTAH